MAKQKVQTEQMNYVYIEILRQVSPNQLDDNFDFLLFGGFDAMKIEMKKDIFDLRRCYESRQGTTPELFDRQPLFLYKPFPTGEKAGEDITDEEDIFSNDGKFQEWPLVLTLFQLDKIRLAQSDKIETPDKLISSFKTLVNKEMDGQGITKDKMIFQVFWNLGESDVVVIFRSATLNVLAKIIHALRMGKRDENNEEIRIISTSSHCAFPKPDVKGEIPKDVSELFQEHLKNWLRNEFEGQSSEFVTLFNISDKYHSQRSNAALLFGEWDYMYYYLEKDKEDFISLLTNIFSHLICEKKEADFKVSYTIPVIRNLPVLDTEKGDSGGEDKQKQDRKWIEDLKKAMQKLQEQTKHIFKGDEEATKTPDSPLLENLESISYSVEGIAKFLYRLKEGRFEEDLYAYVEPVFESLIRITESVTEKIEKFGKEGYEAKANDHVRYYISDTANLLGKLQHLFSIMAVSPHTFMETYGSDMRSLAASDKLLNAYQGVIRFLIDKFPNHILNEESSHTILVLPYRATRSMHMLLYGNLDPMYRISYIQIDYAKMFDLKSTVFMLLHECGHHLGERLRQERLQYFTEAAICLCFEWSGGEKLIQEPILTFLLRMNKSTAKEEQEREECKLFGNLKNGESIKNKYGKKIRKRTADGIRTMSTSLSQNIEVSYLDYIYRNNPDEEKELYFRSSIVKYLSESYIPMMFGFNTKDKVSIDLLNEYKDQHNKDIAAVQLAITQQLSDIANDLADNIIAQNGANIREALRLKTVYKDTEGFAKRLMERAVYLIPGKIKEGALEMLGETFSDIYSDVFAIRILNIGMDEYVKIFPRLLGMDLHEILKPSPLFRVFTVLEACWSDATKKQQEILSGLANGNEQIKKELDQKWNEFKQSSYRPDLTDYAKKCNNKMKELVKKVEKKEGAHSLEQLRNMFKDEDTKKQIDGIFYFCKYLMKGEADKNGH